MADDDDDNGNSNDRRSVRHRGKHHKMAAPGPWPDAAAAAVGSVAHGSVAARAVGHHRRNDTAVRPQTHAVLHAGAPASMCYTTNEVLVIIAVTCFLNFAFVLLVMTCVHCFTDPSHHKKFGAVTYAELAGDEQLLDADIVDGDAVTLLNPTKWPDSGDYDPESCGPYHSLIAPHDRRPRCKSRRRSDDDGGGRYPYQSFE